MVIYFGFILFVMTGLMNRLRGGALNDYLASKGRGRVSHTITRLLLCVLNIVSLYIPIVYNTDIELFSTKESVSFIIVVFLSVFIVGILPGWGSYFDLGNTKREFVDHREVLWIDWVLYKIFGAIWIPRRTGHKTKFEKDNQLIIKLNSFDLKPSPTGYIRPIKWRFRRDFVGMSLRGLHFYIPSMIILFFHLVVCFNIQYWSIFYIIPFGLCFGLIYKISQKLDSEYVRNKLKRYYAYFEGYTQKGEFLTGSLLLSGIPFFILLYFKP